LNLGEKNSSTFKDFQGCMGTLTVTESTDWTDHFAWRLGSTVHW